MMQTNVIICGDALTELKKLPDESINMCCSSPPYWVLRAYGTNPQIWGGDEECEHKWGKEIPPRGKSNYDGGKGKKKTGVWDTNNGQFCSLCGAWRGELGLEPTFELFIDHLCTIYDQVFRVLRKDGCCFVNLGSTYCSGGEDDRMELRSDLTDEEISYVFAELAKCKIL